MLCTGLSTLYTIILFTYTQFEKNVLEKFAIICQTIRNYLVHKYALIFSKYSFIINSKQYKIR